MAKNGLTYLNVAYDRSRDELVLWGAHEFNNDVSWSLYMRDFTLEDVLTHDYKCWGNAECWNMVKMEGLGSYLDEIKLLLREGGHKGMEFFYNEKLQIKVIYCKHTDVLGLRNQDHAIRAGGIRRHAREELELDVIIDGLNLARAMTYKNCWARLPYGGSKIVAQSEPVNLSDMEEPGFYAWVIDRTRSFTGPDMGFYPEFADVLRECFTRNIAGGRRLGPTGEPTALGEYLAMKTVYRNLYGRDSLKGVTVAIQGLGSVGLPLARYLLEEGAELIVTDVDRGKVEKVVEVAKSVSRGSVKCVEPDEIYDVDAEVFFT